ncbi:MAG: Rpn family recombination-promoting nuclease/putative transposase [Treponema sp.]|nr:Rpn family recombination-promoting nuclease/putative transposase [Treponema sp.]
MPINAVLEGAGWKQIESVKITSPFNLRKSIHDKESIMDVKVFDTDGHTYDVGIQNITCPEIMERLTYYGTRMYSELLDDSQQYNELKHCTVNGSGMQRAVSKTTDWLFQK